MLERQLPEADLLRQEAIQAAELAAAPSGGGDAACKVALRRIKYRTVGALILRDLEQGPEAVPEVTRGLSDLADALCDGALAFGRRRLEAVHGAPPWDEGGFVAIAMGKHGAQELNYASDIDLVFISGPQAGQTDGDRPLPVATFANRIASLASSLLADWTEDGFCFRVDTNLRPDGRAGALCWSVDAAEHYYLSWGRTWERSAWLKARPCAGDRALGEELLRRIAPFRYRRSLDFATLEDLATMRDRIAASAEQQGLSRDLKRGPGGIREVEFLVQARQLIWAGRRPELRVAPTLLAIDRLDEAGVLPDGVDGAGLKEAYCLLRAAEHRLQWPEEAQTHILPHEDDEAGWMALAVAFAGPGQDVDLPGLKERLAEARRTVERAWSQSMPGHSQGGTGSSVDPFASAEDRREGLIRLGFGSPEEAERRLAALADLGSARRMSPASWRKFERVLPVLLQAASETSDPDAALVRLEQFVQRVGARGTTYSLLYENPGVGRSLVRLFAGSGFLAELLIQHPELLDALVLRGRGGEQGPRLLTELWSELSGRLEVAEDHDTALSTLRTFHTTELLRVGLTDLSGTLPEDGLPNRHLSDLGWACVRGAHRVAAREMAERHGWLRLKDGGLCPLAVLGMGSVGSRWMTYGSDLDLAFVFGNTTASSVSDGARPLDSRTWTARWAQRLITALSVVSREGRCYEVDLRLRAESGSGPVVVSQAGFSAYYRDRARPWERIALARAAVLSASMEGFADDLGRALAALRRIDSPQVLVEEAREMRRRQVAALRSTGSPLDFLKRGQGGLADLEFAVACMQLTQREGHPARSEADPLLALAALADDGALSISEAQALASDYRVLRRAEARIRFARSLASRSVEELQGPGRGPEGLSRSMLSSEDLSDVVAASMQRILLLSRELMGRVEATC